MLRMCGMYFWHLFIGYNKHGRGVQEFGEISNFFSLKCMMEKIEYDNMLIMDSKCSMKYDGFAICVGDNNAITL